MKRGVHFVRQLCTGCLRQVRNSHSTTQVQKGENFLTVTLETSGHLIYLKIHKKGQPNGSGLDSVQKKLVIIIKPFNGDCLSKRIIRKLNCGLNPALLLAELTILTATESQST